MVAALTTADAIGAIICASAAIIGFIVWLIWDMRRPLAEDETLLPTDFAPEAESDQRITPSYGEPATLDVSSLIIH